MAFQRYSPSADKHYIADTVADLEKVPFQSMGDTCFVIENGKEYMANSKGEWICAEETTIKEEEITVVPEIDMSAYVTKEMLVEHMSKYEIRNCPDGTIIDHRDKEIRIFCQEDAKFVKQTVGNGGNPNMYYMTFRSYAPQGAFYLKEGDKGIILDEEISLYGGTGTGVDEYGRRFKDHWFALASYNEAADTWTYFGATSNATKYIGWTYVAEWYAEDGKLINTDSIRINLSNKECHNLLAPYYG